jgi:hypothetical protein
MMEADEVDGGADGGAGCDGGQRSEFLASLKCPETREHRNDPEQDEVRREREHEVRRGEADGSPREAVGTPCSSAPTLVPYRLSGGLIARVVGWPRCRHGRWLRLDRVSRLKLTRRWLTGVARRWLARVAGRLLRVHRWRRAVRWGDDAGRERAGSRNRRRATMVGPLRPVPPSKRRRVARIGVPAGRDRRFHGIILPRAIASPDRVRF